MSDAPATTAFARRGVHPLTEDRSLFDGPRATYGRFRILHQIGAGSVGPVFRGEDAETRQRVVIKVIRVGLTPERVAIVAAALAALRDRLPAHPGLAPIIDTGVTDVEPYIVTPWIDGDSLDVALREYGPAHMADALPRLRRLADAMDAAAAVGVVHGSLHLRDIVVSVDQTVLTGMGVAAVLERVGVRPPVRRPYCAPEVAAGHGISPAGDQYALAAVAHEWLSGRRLSGAGAAGFQVPAASIDGGAALKAVFAQALDESPDDRYPTVTAFVDALAARSADAAPRSARTGRRAASAEAPRLAFDEPLEDDEPAPDAGGLTAGLTSPTAIGGDVDEDIVGDTPLGHHDLRGASDVTWGLGDDEVGLPTPGAVTLGDEADAVAPADDPADPAEAPAIELGDEATEPVSEIGSGPPADASMTWGRWAAFIGLLMVSAMAGGWALLRWGTPAPQPTTTSATTAPAPARASSASPAPAVATPPQATPPAVATAAPAPGAGVRASAPAAAPSPAAASRSPEAGRASSTALSPAAVPAPSRPRVETPAERRPASAAAPRGRAATPAPAAGRLLMRSTPTGAEVFVNGERRGVTPLTLRGLAFGSYVLRFVHPGRTPSEHRVVLDAGRPGRSLDVTLARSGSAPPPASVEASVPGSLLVESRPAGARVLVDGREVGVTPVTVASLPPGAHTVRIERAGYVPITTTARVEARNRARIAVSLTVERPR